MQSASDPARVHSSSRHDEAPEDAWICFNPACTFPYSRIFKAAHQHRNMQKCKKWITALHQIQHCLAGPDSGGELKGLVLDLSGAGMLHNLEAWSMASRVDWDQFLKGYKLFYMQKAENQINDMIGRLRARIAGLKGNETMSCLQSLLHNMKSGSPQGQFQARRQVEHIIINYITPMQNKKIEISCLKAKDIEVPLF